MHFSSWLMAWIISSFGSSFVCFMKESFFTNLESRSFTSLTHFVYNTWIFSWVDCKETTNSLKSWHTWTMNDIYARSVLLVKTFLILWKRSIWLTSFFPLYPGSVGSIFKKYSFKILTSTLSRLSQQVWQWFIT